jgi:hypothetical protein
MIYSSINQKPTEFSKKPMPTVFHPVPRSQSVSTAPTVIAQDWAGIPNSRGGSVFPNEAESLRDLLRSNIHEP